MSALKKGLGRGFESLIPTDLIDDSFNPNSTFDPTAKQDERVSTEKVVPITQLHANPDQPRRHFDADALMELAASIKEHGVLQPIIVVPKGDGYEIVAGERRFRASKVAELTEVPVIIRSLTDQHQLEISLIENIQRRDLNAIETAVAYAKLRDQFNLSNDQISGRVHKSVPAVVNTMRLLKLPKEAVALVAEGILKEGQVRPLIGQDEADILEVLPKIVNEGWSARKVEQYVAHLKSTKDTKNPVKTKPPRYSYEAEADALKNRLDTKVTVKTNAQGAGSIVISFKDQIDFHRIQKLL